MAALKNPTVAPAPAPDPAPAIAAHHPMDSAAAVMTAARWNGTVTVGLVVTAMAAVG